MSIKITTLVENTKGEHLGLINEHGLSFYIEMNGHRLLFDAGQSDAFLKNAEQLRIDLSSLEYVVLSHGHYDHSGGLRALTEKAKKFELIIGGDFFLEKYGYADNSYEFLGNNFDEKFLSAKGIPYRRVTQELTELCPGVFVLTAFPRVHTDEIINPRFKVLRNGAFEQDNFYDELLIALDTPKGIVVLLGCSHPGMRNLLDAVRARLKKPIYAVLGGTHLVEAHGPSLEKSLDFLRSGAVEIVGVSHCTGQEAVSLLNGSGEKYFSNRTGTSFIVE